MNTTDLLLLVLNLELPREIHEVVLKGAIAKGLEAKQLLEAYRTVYALGFYDGAVHGTRKAKVINDC